MVPELKNAFDAVSRMDESFQRLIAHLITEELADEERWQASFDRSQDQLKTMAEEAMRDDAAGLTTENF